jgi:hypothetical protein
LNQNKRLLLSLIRDHRQSFWQQENEKYFMEVLEVGVKPIVY